METWTWDIESNNLLNNETIDYMSSPYKLKDSFKMHCIVIEEHGTGIIHAFYDGPTYLFDGRSYKELDEDLGYVYILENYKPIEYVHHQLNEFKSFVEQGKVEKVIAHNGINFDWLACKLYFDMDYTVEPDTWCNKSIEIVDTLVLSKCLNPDRFGGHSLDKLSEKVGLRKINFRPYCKDNDRFVKFAADMVYYCIRDVQVNTKVYNYLMDEKGNWPWDDAIKLEKCVAEIITRQEHRGFKFNKELAEKNIKQLDTLMEERRVKVEPVLPTKQATKKFMGEYTPPARQFLKTGEPSSYLIKFAEKIGAVIECNDGGEYVFIFNNTTYKLPLPQTPLITSQKATIDDTTHIKDWLIREFGWQPSEYKEKDLSVNTKKEKLSPDKLEAAIDRYVEQTLNSAFCSDRCEHLNTTPHKLKSKLLSYKEGRAIKVLTNPNFTVGQEKELCPHLLALAEKFPYARDVVEYHTYKHRRNSILGGGLDFDDEEPEKGYLSALRDDGRIPTPADPCGAATSRFKHRLVANIPRVTSIFGPEMRGLFGVDSDFIQIGYDFDSLEAREEAHYCWKYDDDSKEYCKSLTMEKPNDVHTKMAARISDILNREFQRGPAKSVKYGCTYGAQEAKVAKTIGCDLETGGLIYNAFWQAAFPLAELKLRLAKYWETTGGKKFIIGIDKRKIPTRSAHAILNSLFQSAGVICAKRAMVIHDRKLKDAGLLVDFFKEDWRSKHFCQQLIAYHDESQLEVSKSLVKFKTFPITLIGDKEQDKEHMREVKEIAVKWKKEQEISTGKIFSDIGHTTKCFYVGYTLAGELAVQSVLEAGKYYNLNVDLTAGYMLGTDWASCH